MEGVRASVVPLFLVSVSTRSALTEGGGGDRSNTRILRVVGIRPTEIIDQRAAFLNTGAILCIILMDVEPKK